MSDERIKQALEQIADFGDTDGGHHKQWALDQVVRILTGCPVKQKTVTHPDGTEYSYAVLGESEEYHKWLREFAAGEDGPHTYQWDIGTPP